jgi:hypothetical protein
MTRLSRGVVALVLALGLASAGGCSLGDSGKGTVTGEVTLDGKPLKEGIIRFIPADGKSQTADATITDGRYTAQVPVGDKRIEISASKIVGKRKMIDEPGAPAVDDVVELLPERYNVKSQLTLTVQRGRQEKRFELQSK